MSGFELLKHHQLHEVLFAYLDTNHLLDCRCIGSECDEMVVRYAQGQLQDVLGQDLTQGCLPGLDGDMVCDICSLDCSLRTVNACLVKLLLVCGEGLGQSATGVRSLSAKLIAGTTSTFVLKVFNALCEAMTIDSMEDLLHVDVGKASTPASANLVLLAGTYATHLRSVILDADDGITDKELGIVATNCRKLKFLSVWNTSDRITDRSISRVARNCTELQSLDVSRTGMISDDSMEALLSNCKQLRILSVGLTKGITDKSISALVSRHLRMLDIKYTDGGISDGSLSRIAVMCPDLRALDVSYTGGSVSDSSVQLFATHCPHLRTLKVRGTRGKITDEAILVVANHCPELRILHVAETRGAITDKSIALVAKNCRRLTSLKAWYTDGRITDAACSLLPPTCEVDTVGYCWS